MDKLALWEINNIVDNLIYTDSNLWEIGRLNAYMVAKANFKGVKKMSDLFKLPWEEEKEQKKNKPKLKKTITDEEIKRLKEKAKMWS